MYTAGSTIDNVYVSHPSLTGPTEPGQLVTLTNAVGVTVTPGFIRKTNQSSWWSSRAFSTQKVSSGLEGGISFKAIGTNDYRMIGLSTLDQGPTWNSIKYNIYLRNDGTIDLYSFGTKIQDLGDYQGGDRFGIERKEINGDVYMIFTKNGLILWGMNGVENEDLYVDICMYTPGGELDEIRLFTGDMISPSIPVTTPPNEQILTFNIDSENDTLYSDNHFVQFDSLYNPSNCLSCDGNNIFADVEIDSITYSPNLTDSLATSNDPSDQVYMYPNPTKERVWVKSSSWDMASCTFYLFDHRTMSFHSVFPTVQDENQVLIEVSAYLPGVYTLNIRKSDGLIVEKRLIIE